MLTAWHLGSRALPISLEPPDLGIALKMATGLSETSLNLSQSTNNHVTEYDKFLITTVTNSYSGVLSAVTFHRGRAVA
jgi:hypothetical protein